MKDYPEPPAGLAIEHDGNVLAGDGGYRVIDWGDSGVAHPFATLLVTLRSVGNAFELGDWTPFGPAAPELERLRDAYLEPWSDRLARAELVRLVRIAGWTGMLASTARALYFDGEHPRGASSGA